jgi:hypothetical protein
VSLVTQLTNTWKYYSTGDHQSFPVAFCGDELMLRFRDVLASISVTLYIDRKLMLKPIITYFVVFPRRQAHINEYVLNETCS